MTTIDIAIVGTLEDDNCRKGNKGKKQINYINNDAKKIKKDNFTMTNRE